MVYNYTQSFKKEITQNILKTICYSDIFDYPLTRNQIWKFYMGKIISQHQLYLIIESLDLVKQKKYYSLKGRSNIISKRTLRKKESMRKMRIAMKICNILSVIPFIKLIGVSGSLSLYNAQENDDIDLFIITKHNSVWITRLLVTGCLALLGKKRKKNEHHPKDTICTNMFLSENSLSFEKTSQNLFIAHEIAQLHVIVNKKHTYEQFLSQNSWILKFLPNTSITHKYKKSNYSLTNKIGSSLFWVLDYVLYKFQLNYMKRHRTREIVTQNKAQFHPLDKQREIMNNYSKNVINILGLYGDFKRSFKANRYHFLAST